MREALDIGESRFELRQDFESPFCFMFGAQPFRNLFGGFVGTANVADRLKGDHELEDLFLK